MFWALATVFGFCEFGERLTGGFDEINQVYDQFVWYLFPYRAQHILTTLLMIAQKPVELCAFGSVSCGRITFKNVSKNSILSATNHQYNFNS